MWLRKLAYALPLFLFLFAASCQEGPEQQGPAEEIGESIDEAAEESREAADEAGDAVEETGDAVGDAVEEMEEE
jgi:hypothetical protein